MPLAALGWRDAATVQLLGSLASRQVGQLAAYNNSFDAGIGYEFLTNYMHSEHAQARAEGRGVNRL